MLFIQLLCLCGFAALRGVFTNNTTPQIELFHIKN